MKKFSLKTGTIILLLVLLGFSMAESHRNKQVVRDIKKLSQEGPLTFIPETIIWDKTTTEYEFNSLELNALNRLSRELNSTVMTK